MVEPHSASAGAINQAGSALRRGRPNLLPALLDVQKRDGYISEGAAQAISAELEVPLAEIYGVIEFYDLLSALPAARKVIRFCTSAVCCNAGSWDEIAAVCQKLDVQPGEPTADGEYLVTEIPCLGLCDHAPAALVGDTLLGGANASEFETWMTADGGSPGYQLRGDPRWLTQLVGVINPNDIDAYLAAGGYTALATAQSKEPEEIISTIKASGLVGRGGAAFPTGLKWEGAAEALGSPKYIVVNADESEVGTFKDRVLLENDPFSILEGMTIAAYAVGARYGYIFVRGEYQHAQHMLSQALKIAEEAGYLGENILKSGQDFTIELRSGAGAYICGEETALFESIEGKRGFPRIKPPFPTTHGLFGCPTIVNNVETLCNVPVLLRNGTEAYRRVGTAKSPGTKLFCLSGDVVQPGVVEAPFGLTLSELIEGWGGGVKPDRNLQAVLLGGAAGVFVTPEQLDITLTFEDLQTAGLALGSGAMMVFDDSRDLRQILLSVAHFFAHESCGKCYPCQLGTQRQLEILERVAEGRTLPGDISRLQDVGWTMNDASLCGLGQTAALAILSALDHWPELFLPPSRA